MLRTAHYAITSTATRAQTAQVAAAVEHLHDAYSAFFRDAIPPNAGATGLQLVLYRDRAEFQSRSRSSPWAEAYYLQPVCHAYYADGANPYHWMLHEATHQLNRELAGFPRAVWIDEGLASYFGASHIENGVLKPGTIDVGAYPIWWLPELALSGDLQDDLRKGSILSLREIITSRRGDIGRSVNPHYIGYWSLTHFLFEYRDGHYAAAYRQLIARGGSLDDFERLIGPVERVQGEWYAYLQQRIGEVRAGR